MGQLAIVGAGFVADLYMRSLSAFPQHAVTGVWDHRPERLAAVCAHWGVPAARGLDDVLTGPKRPDLLLNLTNPHAHADINHAALEAGLPVWCEKPLAMTLVDARALIALSERTGVPIASAPCSALSPTAQTLAMAVRNRLIGKAQLIYADLDDGYVTKAPHHKWTSESGAPWPAHDEFAVGCTLEHAGYYLTWLMAMFGPVRRVVAHSATLIPDKLGPGAPGAPDFTAAVLTFDDNVVARLTCSILARHDHRIRIVGTHGTLSVNEAWDNVAPVRLARRATLRRRLVDGLWRERVPLVRPDTPRPRRFGAAAMNFMLGPDEMLEAIAAGRPPRLAGHVALHLTEVTLAIQNAVPDSPAIPITSSFAPIAPMPWAARPAKRRGVMPSNRRRAMPVKRLAIVGTGRMARAMRAAAAATGTFEVSAVISQSQARADGFAADMGVALAFDSLDKLPAGAADAVYIANANTGHAAAALAAIEAGKPVLLEKPAATTPAEVERIVDAARAAGILVMEALWTPMLPAHRRALALAHGGTLGKPHHLTMDFGYPADPAAMPALFQATGGGVLLDRMVYPLGLALTLFGPVADVSAALTARDGVDVHASLQLRHVEGGLSQLSASLTTLMSNTARIALTEGAITIEPPVVGSETVAFQRAPTPAGPTNRAAPPLGATAKARLTAAVKASGAARRLNRAVSGPTREPHGFGPNQYGPLLTHFAGLIASGAGESDVITHDLTLSIQRVLAEARRSLPAPPQGGT